MLVDQYGRPIQTPMAPSSFGVGDVLGGAAFEQLLGRGKEAVGKATEATTKALEKQGGIRGLGRTGLGLAGKYAPLVGGGIQLLQGDPLGAVGSVAGGVLGAPFGPLGSIAGAALGGAALKAVAAPVAQAAQGMLGGAARTEMARGESPGLIPGIGGTGIGFTDQNIKDIAELSRITGQSQVDIARQMLPISQEFRNAEMQRQMQLNQQTGQITGALNRQLYTAQLAQGAQSQAGETTRTMMTAANPYAASAFQYRG